MEASFCQRRGDKEREKSQTNPMVWTHGFLL